MPESNEKRRERYQMRKEDGLCPRCGAGLKDDNFISCEHCRSYYREFPTPSKEQKQRYDSRLADNKCPRCGKKHKKGYLYKLCPACIKQITKRD